jgi:hypothetical protein
MLAMFSSGGCPAGAVLTALPCGARSSHSLAALSRRFARAL